MKNSVQFIIDETKRKEIDIYALVGDTYYKLDIVDGVEYDGLTPYPTESGRYCYAPITHKATLGRIVELLHTFLRELSLDKLELEREQGRLSYMEQYLLAKSCAFLLCLCSFRPKHIYPS